MPPSRIGKLKPIYTLLLNPHTDVRLSRCPKCERPTFARKFPLLVHAQGHGLYVQAKTCKYCSRCKMVMVQQDELEAQLAHAARRRFPAALGHEYMIIGVAELKTFKKSIDGPTSFGELLEHVSDFREQIGLSCSPGGWYREGHEPPVLPSSRPQRIPVTTPAQAGEQT